MANKRFKFCFRNIGFVIIFSITAVIVAHVINCNAKDQKQGEPNNTKSTESKLTLNQIISQRTGWSPAFTNWYGKPAPDFNVTDINGVKHTLSEYKGRNVMIIFWATWCGPCVQEIPHLIQLRKTFGEDKLAMLAISYVDPRNNPMIVKTFVQRYSEKYSPINYTIISAYPEAMTNPYNIVDSIPSSFFIDAQGRIKFATEGMTPLPQMKAIIEAER